MKATVKNYLEEVLHDYPYTKAYIKHRMEELIYPFHAHQSASIGTCFTEPKVEGTAMLAINIATDRRLHQLEINKNTVQVCLLNSDELTQDIVKEMYFKKHPVLTLEGVGQELNIDHTTVSRRRNAFLKLLGEQLGVI